MKKAELRAYVGELEKEMCAMESELEAMRLSNVALVEFVEVVTQTFGGLHQRLEEFVASAKAAMTAETH